MILKPDDLQRAMHLAVAMAALLVVTLISTVGAAMQPDSTGWDTLDAERSTTVPFSVSVDSDSPLDSFSGPTGSLLAGVRWHVVSKPELSSVAHTIAKWSGELLRLAPKNSPPA